MDVDGVSGMIPTDPMAALIAEDLVKAVQAESANPEHRDDVRGSRLDLLVEVMRLCSNPVSGLLTRENARGRVAAEAD